MPVCHSPACRPPAAWPWLVASVVIHLFYFAALIESYRTGDLGQVYPIARGAAPLMTAGAATVFVGEPLSLLGWSGIVVLVAGVLLLSARGGRELARIDRRAVGFALVTALTICTYSVVDGIGARLSRNPQSYVLWMFLGNALLLVPYALWRDGRDVVPAMRRFWRRGLAGGALQVVAYGTVLWAMTLAPIAIVATLARDQRAVRRLDRGRGAEGAAARGAHRRGAADRRRPGADPPAVTSASAGISRSSRAKSLSLSTSHSGGEFDGGQLQRRNALARFGEHRGGAPSHVGEKRRMGCARADQHIAAVLGRDQHHVGRRAARLPPGADARR